MEGRKDGRLENLQLPAFHPSNLPVFQSFKKYRVNQ